MDRNDEGQTVGVTNPVTMSEKNAEKMLKPMAWAPCDCDVPVMEAL